MISRIKGLIASSMQLSTNNTASPAMAGDVAYWDGSSVKTTPYSKWNPSLGTPIGVVVVPEGFAPDGKPRIVSLLYVDASGNTSTSYKSMVWGPYGTDTSLTNFTKVPTTDNNGSTSTGSKSEGYLPSDKFTGATSFVDPKAKYYETSYLIPSPYLGDVPNPEYNKEISGYNNALSDFNGLSNTETLIGLGEDYVAANAAYKYNDGVSNLQWYLPAMGELGYLIPRFNEINSVITALGGVAVAITTFWSSSEYSSGFAYRLDTYYGYVCHNGKDSNSYVRPFAILDDGEDSGGNNGEDSDGSSNSPITFYLEDTQDGLHQFNAPYSMTWGEFVASEYNTVNELGDKSFRDTGVIQYGDVFRDLTPDGWDCYTEYREVYKNDIALWNYVFPDEYIREDVNYMTS